MLTISVWALGYFAFRSHPALSSDPFLTVWIDEHWRQKKKKIRKKNLTTWSDPDVAANYLLYSQNKLNFLYNTLTNCCCLFLDFISHLFFLFRIVNYKKKKHCICLIRAWDENDIRHINHLKERNVQFYSESHSLVGSKTLKPHVNKVSKGILRKRIISCYY